MNELRALAVSQTVLAVTVWPAAIADPDSRLLEVGVYSSTAAVWAGLVLAVLALRRRRRAAQ